MAIEADLERISTLGGRGTPQGLGFGFGSVARHPCFPQAGAPGDAREQPALAPSLPPPWRKSAMSSEIDHPWPPTSCGARTAFGCSRWTTAGAGYSPPRWNAECVELAVQAATATPTISHDLLRRPGSMPRLACFATVAGRSPWGRAGLTSAGAALRGSRRVSQYLSDHFTRPDQVLGHPAVLRLRRTAPDQRSGRR